MIQNEKDYLLIKRQLINKEKELNICENNPKHKIKHLKEIIEDYKIQINFYEAWLLLKP